MSIFFLLNNLHFSLEILGALAFLMVAWLAFDALKVRKDFLTASRGIGFSLLVVWQVLHAFGYSAELYGYAGYSIYFLGIIFILINLILEAPTKRPEFKAIIILPAFAVLFSELNIVATIGLFLITFFSYRQYKKEFKKTLASLTIAFLFLFLGSLLSIFYEFGSTGFLWILAHTLQLIGFFSLAVWVWQYLSLRIREELLLIFISITLFMSVIITLTFSTILIGRIEADTQSNLLTNAKVLDFALLSLQEEALAKAQLVAQNTDIKNAVLENDFVVLEKLIVDSLEKQKLGFLTITDSDGLVILRAHGLTKKDDNLLDERAVGEALLGNSFVTIESSPVEKFSIRAGAPLKSNEEIIGHIHIYRKHLDVFTT